ncbi:hypothetical protein [Niabella drilacis]|uniref:Lipoprotein n=1 Tax=Niabella drilacis (strain DSM 25811 / CCM 8410 / CCUG 62505 / LMG 26954 / E90) TaxID=1285928 RepID=A0A1G6UTY7_NIADE|nr:hypothetical protein [Niabella drilacis]SDD44025.1 hypothetical protein SAMN04487894_10970 [Niabella drilacis]
MDLIEKILAFSLAGLFLSSCDSVQGGGVEADGIVHVNVLQSTEQAQSDSFNNASALLQEVKKEPPFYRMVSIYSGRIEVSVPTSFVEMSAEKVTVKYPNVGNRPNVVYTNDRANVNIAFTYTTIPAEQGDLQEIKDALSLQLRSAKPVNLRSWIENVNGSDYVVFELESQAIDTMIYNLMFATDVDGKLLLGSFNCPYAIKNEWQKKAREILSSIRKG